MIRPGTPRLVLVSFAEEKVYVEVEPLFVKLAATLLAVGRPVLLAGQPLLVAAAAGPAAPAIANRVVVAVAAARLMASTRIRLRDLKPMFVFPPPRILAAQPEMWRAARHQTRFNPLLLRSKADTTPMATEPGMGRHSTTQTTSDIYQHVRRASADDAAERVAALLLPGRPG